MATAQKIRDDLVAPLRQIPRLISATEVASILGISRTNLYAHVSRANFIQPVRIGSSMRFREDLVLEFIERGGMPAKPVKSRTQS
ncbi:MAG: helix-turn-helix domain-containing protein [Gammaproteobacteria bacterium]